MAIKYSQLTDPNVIPKDLDSINNLLKQMSPSAQTIDADKLSRMLFKYDARIFLAIDEKTGEIIGTATLLHNEKFIARYGVIEDVVVDEKYRGQGIGKKLTEMLIETGRSLGLKHIDLTSRPHRIAANALYKKMGFEPKDTNVYRMLLQ